VLGGGVAGMVGLPVAWALLESYGPASRLAHYSYFPGGLGELAAALLLGASLGGHAAARLLARPARLPVPWIRLGLLLLLAGLWIRPHLDAFPAGAPAAEREAWARARVKEYAALADLAARLPAVASDVGPVRTVAPSADARHAYSQEMNGLYMHFELEIAGERGTGLLEVRCTLHRGALHAWEPARWRFAGRETAVPEPPPDTPGPWRR
jgi:hypothetical protein